LINKNKFLFLFSFFKRCPCTLEKRHTFLHPPFTHSITRLDKPGKQIPACLSSYIHWISQQTPITYHHNNFYIQQPIAMARGGKRGGGGGGGGRGGRSGGSSKGGKESKKSSGRVSGRGTSNPSAAESKAPKKFGQLSRKERDMMEEYGELVPQDFEEDESDRVA
jgi:uncharacterized membrane protein YgcG